MADAFFEESDLWVSGEGGYFAYRIPAMVTTRDNRLLAFSEGRKHTGSDMDEIDLLLRRSSDSGATWDAQRIVVTDGSETCGNPCPIVDGDTGTVWLLYSKNNQRIFVTRSDDEGESWSPSHEITATAKDPSWAFVGTGPCRGIQLRTGRLVAPSWCDESPGPVRWRPDPSWGKIQSSYAIFSDDHGGTWQRGDMLTRDASDECAVVEVADGSVYMNARSRRDIDQRAYAWSRDGGSSWTEIEYDPGQPEPSCQGSLVRFTSSETSDRNRVLLAHPAATDERRQLTVRMSYDECRTWPVARVVTEGRGGYSDLAVAADNTILCAYEGERGLRLARFDVGWLTDGEDQL